MSWSFTVNDLAGFDEEHPDWFPLIERMVTQHPAYPVDMHAALAAAKFSGLKSATLTGCRTPNPAGGPEVVDISVRGFAEPVNFNEMLKKILFAGPEVSNVDAPES